MIIDNFFELLIVNYQLLISLSWPAVIINNMKRILITGASGCIGHYITERLIDNTDDELYLIVRNPEKLGFNYQKRPGIHLIQTPLQNIEQFAELLKTINIAILAATSWGGVEEVYDVNVNKTLRLIQLLDHQICQHIIYFSTASILNHQNQLLPEAGTLGTDYIRSKYQCLQQLSQLKNIPPVTVLFPTLVLGGDADKPYSHLSSGLPEVAKWVSLIRWFKADASFHFIHGADIAKVVEHGIHHPPQTPDQQYWVLGNAPVTANQAVEDACAYFRQKIYFRIPLSLGLANFFIFVFRIQMAEWDRFCLNYRHFTYQTVINPGTFQLPTDCATVTDIFRIFVPHTNSV